MGFDIARLSVFAITAVAVIAVQEAQAVDVSITQRKPRE